MRRRSSLSWRSTAAVFIALFVLSSAGGGIGDVSLIVKERDTPLSRSQKGRS